MWLSKIERNKKKKIEKKRRRFKFDVWDLTIILLTVIFIIFLGFCIGCQLYNDSLKTTEIHALKIEDKIINA